MGSGSHLTGRIGSEKAQVSRQHKKNCARIRIYREVAFLKNGIWVVI